MIKNDIEKKDFSEEFSMGVIVCLKLCFKLKYKFKLFMSWKFKKTFNQVKLKRKLDYITFLRKICLLLKNIHNHFKTPVIIPTEKEFNCDICHRSYSNKGNLKQHIKVHDESKALKCDVCLKLFCNKTQLKSHYKTHTGEKPFACQICDRKFSLKHALTRHQASHRDDKPFKCSICPEGRYFKTKNGLSMHMVFHYERKFLCNYCDHKSYTKSSLNAHEKTHIKHSG